MEMVARTAQTPRILWIAERELTEIGSVPIQRLSPEEAMNAPAGAVMAVLDWKSAEVRGVAALFRMKHRELPMALSADSFTEEEIRTAINDLGVFRFLKTAQIAQELPRAFQEAQSRFVGEMEKEKILQQYAQRNREQEKLNEALEKVVSERTGVLAESTREEKDKLARERQLIRFLKEISSQKSTDDVLRVLQRELRRYHKIQNIIVVMRQSGGLPRFFSFRGNQVVRSEGATNFSLLAERGADLRGHCANHFGRPFNRMIFFPLEMSFTGEGLLGIEYSLMDEAEIRDIAELLTERLRPVAITFDRLLLEDGLRRSARRWERTFDGFRDPISIVDAEMNVLRGNRAFTENKFQQKRCFEAFAASEVPCESCPVAETPMAQETLSGSVRVGLRSYQLSSWPVRELQGAKVTGRVTHYADVTESRDLYLRMLQNEKMSAIGSLAGHIAHELNNPLTGIRSLAQALRAEVGDDEAPLRDDLSQIESAAGRCQKIIKHLLDFTRGEEGPLQAVSLDEIVENTLPLLKSAVRRHRFEFLLNARKTRIWANPHLLQQVVFNLVNNACQAMKAAGALAISTRVDGNGTVEMRIRDSGPGMTEEVKARLFEPFFTTKKEGEGTGLGLSTSKAIVERFGGSVAFASELGKGTEFVLRFPVGMGGQE